MLSSCVGSLPIMPGHSRSKNCVLSERLCVELRCLTTLLSKTWMAGTRGRLRPSSTGYARPCRKTSVHVQRMWECRRKARPEPQHEQRAQLNDDERDDANIDV